MVDFSCTELHNTLVDDAQQLNPPLGQQTVNLILVANVVVMRRGENLALAYGTALDGILRE